MGQRVQRRELDTGGGDTQAWPAHHPERRAVSVLIPSARNAIEHTEEGVAQLADAIRHFGWTFPVLIDETNEIMAGHGRVLAAKQLGITDVPVIVARGWSEEQKRAYRIADNKLGRNADWDQAKLADELADLRELGIDLDLIGFEAGEVDKLLGDAEPGIAVREIPTGPVNDLFWIQVRGPLARQAEALSRLKAMMAEWPEVSVRLGTIEDGT